MKKFNKIMPSIFLLMICLGARSQTITMTVVHQPCHLDGIVVATTTGLTPPITYYWFDGYANTVSHTTNNLSDTIFNFPGGMALGIRAKDGFNEVDSLFNFTTPFTSTVTVVNPACPVNTGTCSIVTTGGQSPFTVTWNDFYSGNQIATGTNVTLSTGQYLTYVTDANGCTIDPDTFLVYQQNYSLSAFVTTTTANCTNGTASVTSVTGGVPPYTYLWSNGQTTQQITNLTTGYYTVKVTDALGCTGDSLGYGYVPQSITINDNLVTTAATCVQNNGSAISFCSGGVPPYSYIYSTGQTTQTATGLVGGNYYSVQVTDANNCIGSGYFYINSSTPITVTYNASQSSCTQPTGSATITINGGQAPYTTVWATSPVQTGTVVSNLLSGTYQFNTTDANGCVQSGTVYIPPISNLSAYPSWTDALCPTNNGAAYTNANSSYMPITYLWNTGATTPSIGNLSPGTYTCTITDNLGCQLYKTIYVNQTSPINLGFSSTPASCIYTNDGVINLTPTGGTAPYTYQWAGGQTTQNISGLATNYYTVTVTDNNGCTQTDTIYLSYNTANNSCYCTVTGNVYYDANGNCIKDVGETNVDNMLIKNNNTITAYNINNYVYTDAAGNYSFILPTGSYNIQEVIQYMYPLSSCQSNNNPITLTASAGCTYTVDFANGINPLHDVHIYNASLTLPVPGNNYVQQVIIENNGTVAENNIQLGYAHDGQLLYSGSSAITLTQPNSTLAPNWYDNTSTVPALNPGQWTTTQITYAVPTNIPLATVVNFWDSTAYAAPMSNWLNDYTPWNNVKAFNETIIGSFDPNFKEVSPQGVGPQGLVPPTDTVFDYVIHFQNTGSAPANKIVVRDSIDGDFVIESLKPGYSNHNYVASIDNKNVLTFTFNNINLPDMYNYPLGSIGIVAYSIHAKKNLPVGTQFKNNAAIYFDYNAPVITNTTINTISNSTGINEIKSTDNAMSLFPNPALENYSLKITVEEENASGKVNIYSLDGSLISENNITLTKGVNVFNYSVANLSAGIYIIRVLEGGRQHITKLSVVK